MEEFNNMKKKWSPKRPKTGKHAKKVVAIVAGVAVVGLFATDCTYQIQEQEQAVLSTFGVPKAVTETGLHFKLPLIQQVHKVNTTIQGFPIGYDQDSNDVVADEGIMITSDYNFIDVDFFVEYRITEPVKYLYTFSAAGRNSEKYCPELYPYGDCQLYGRRCADYGKK